MTAFAPTEKMSVGLTLGYKNKNKNSIMMGIVNHIIRRLVLSTFLWDIMPMSMEGLFHGQGEMIYDHLIMEQGYVPSYPCPFFKIHGHVQTYV